jgi:peptide/nickel transport system substrate-binding protein
LTGPRGAPKIARRAFTASVIFAPLARALDRTPVGGTLRLSLPFRSRELDPHSADDPLSALLATAICDPLFALDSGGRPYPALAATLPEDTPQGARIVLRPGLKSARGKALAARDAVLSLDRSRRLGGAAVLGELGRPRVDPREPLGFFLSGASASAAVTALASPLTALVPRGFNPMAPDGTGAFRATLSASRLVLERNPNGARGAAFLARVEVEMASDLAAALRAFETGAADAGFLGAGLHRSRPGAIAFEGPEYGWVVLRTGKAAGHWGAPGVAQGLADRVPKGALRHLGVRDAGGAVHASTGWGGGA